MFATGHSLGAALADLFTYDLSCGGTSAQGIGQDLAGTITFGHFAHWHGKASAQAFAQRVPAAKRVRINACAREVVGWTPLVGSGACEVMHSSSSCGDGSTCESMCTGDEYACATEPHARPRTRVPPRVVSAHTARSPTRRACVFRVGPPRRSCDASCGRWDASCKAAKAACIARRAACYGVRTACRTARNVCREPALACERARLPENMFATCDAVGTTMPDSILFSGTRMQGYYQ